MNNKSLKKTLLLLLVCMGGFHLYAQFKQPMINLEHFDEKRFQWGYYFGANTFDFKIDYKELNYNVFHHHWDYTAKLPCMLVLLLHTFDEIDKYILYYENIVPFEPHFFQPYKLSVTFLLQQSLSFALIMPSQDYKVLAG